MTSPSPPLFLACLACGRVTPVPPQLSMQAVVRCPHCQTQFSLRDLLVEPTATWEVVSDKAHSDSASAADVRTAATASAVSERRADAGSSTKGDLEDYTYMHPSEEDSPISPGAKTVEMPGQQTFAEGWQEEESEEELFEPVADILFDSNRAASDATVAQPLDERTEQSYQAQPRKLEGPLVGEFYDERPRSRRSSATLANVDGKSSTAEATQQPLHPPAERQFHGERPSYVPKSDARRARKKLPRRSPIWSVLQIALGGIAAIPISFLLMWHLLGTDVGETAPWVAQYVPWIVPEQFHPYAPEAVASSRPQPSDSNDHRSDSLPAVPAAEVDMADGTEDEFPSVEPRALSELNLSLEEAPNRRRVDETLAHARPATGYADSNDNSPSAALPETGSTHLEPSALETCFAKIRQTESRLEEWPQAVSAQRDDATSMTQLKKLARVTYNELTSLAMTIDELPVSDAVLQAVREQLHRIGQQVEQESEVRRLIEGGSRFWVEQQLETQAAANQETTDSVTTAADSKTAGVTPATANLTYGLAMTMKLDSVKQSADGRWWLATPTPATQPGEVPLEIRIPRDLTIPLPDDTLADGQSLFLLGTVRPSRVFAVNSTDEAPQAQSFVASYLYPL